MAFEEEKKELASRILAAQTAPELVAHFAELIRTDPKLPGVGGHKLFLSDIDDTLPHIGKVLGFRDQSTVKSDENVCIVATQLLQIGGHSRVVRDIIDICQSDISVIVTEVFRSRQYTVDLKPAKIDGINSRGFVILRSPTAVERALELYNILCALKPTRIFLLHSHMDISAVAATYPFRGIVEFIHHADYAPSLGATVEYSQHVDVTYGTYECCKQRGLNPIYTSLSVPGEMANSSPGLGDRQRRLATSGGANKFKADGDFQWTDWVIASLQGNDALFFHIGPIDKELGSKIHGTLAQAGIDQERYRFLGPVPSVRDALATLKIDTYIASAPLGGGLACLEALAMRIPMVVPHDPKVGPLVKFSLPIPGWVPADRPAEMPDAIGRCDALQSYMNSAEYGDLVAAEFKRFEGFVLEPAGPSRIESGGRIA